MVIQMVEVKLLAKGSHLKFFGIISNTIQRNRKRRIIRYFIFLQYL